ncbi:phospholipase D-like domain-containing protein [Nocardioides jensenii]|uniref:phospholipase D-like domain-containing protein n=1 Tax=Nocardioides jensenii TaxID=1843 RepID=UPI00082DB4C5|nr:phospholipase D-like domain-containing protein [Nocardioides jensenii]
MTSLSRALREVGVILGRLRLALPALLLVVTTGCFSDSPATPDQETARPDAGHVVHPGPVLGVPADREDPASHAVVARILELIENTPAGERIRIVGRSFSLQPVASAMIAAHERGVRVQIAINGAASRDFKAVARMTEAFGTDRSADSFVHLSPRSAPRSHQKIWTFTRTGESRRVVLFGSANLSYLSLQQYSDMYVFVGRDRLWRVAQRNFRDRAGLAPGSTHGLNARFGHDELWLYPKAEGTTDPVLQVLAPLPADQMTLRIVAHAWYGPRGDRIARTAVDKFRAGARVEVIGATVGDSVRAILENAGVPVHPGRFANGEDVHNKLMLVQWVDQAGKRRRTILTGSDNWAAESFERSEGVMAIDASHGPAWSAYLHWYAGLRDRSVR